MSLLEGSGSNENHRNEKPLFWNAWISKPAQAVREDGRPTNERPPARFA